jgi:hypothetical protein
MPPAVTLLVALAMPMKVDASPLAALRLAVGFAGIFVAFDLFVHQVAPAVRALVTITWAAPIAPLTVVIVLALNVTRTVAASIAHPQHSSSRSAREPRSRHPVQPRDASSSYHSSHSHPPYFKSPPAGVCSGKNLGLRKASA